MAEYFALILRNSTCTRRRDPRVPRATMAARSDRPRGPARGLPDDRAVQFHCVPLGTRIGTCPLSERRKRTLLTVRYACGHIGARFVEQPGPCPQPPSTSPRHHPTRDVADPIPAGGCFGARHDRARPGTARRRSARRRRSRPRPTSRREVVERRVVGFRIGGVVLPVLGAVDYGFGDLPAALADFERGRGQSPLLAGSDTGDGTSTGRRDLVALLPRSSPFGAVAVMRAEGLEPPRAEAHQDLNLARIPIPPRPRGARVCGLNERSMPRLGQIL
jgi:hypothetical protein